MKTFYVRFPGDFHPVSFSADSEKAARQAARDWLKVTRLPRGTEVWEFTPQARKIIEDNHRQMRRDYAKAGQVFEP